MKGLCAGPMETGCIAHSLSWKRRPIQLGKRVKPHPLVYSQVASPSNLLITLLTDCSPAGDNCKTVTAVERFP
jgi:hypothetical protein